MATALLLVMSLFVATPPGGALLPSAAPVQQTAAAAAPVSSPLDYEIFKSQVQPILIGARKGNARCSACHAGGGGNSYLEPLPPGTDDLHRGTKSPQLRARVAPRGAGGAAEERAARQPAGSWGGGGEWHGGGETLALPGRSGMADAGRRGSAPRRRRLPSRGGVRLELRHVQGSRPTNSISRARAMPAAARVMREAAATLSGTAAAGRETYTEEQSRVATSSACRAWSFRASR